VSETDLAGTNASFANPTSLVGLIEWAETLFTE
jgi:hypothetical protein